MKRKGEEGTELALPEGAVSSTTSHRTEEVRVDLDDLLDGLARWKGK